MQNRNQFGLLKNRFCTPLPMTTREFGNLIRSMEIRKKKTKAIQKRVLYRNIGIDTKLVHSTIGMVYGAYFGLNLVLKRYRPHP